jgi:hypothetical protein
MKHFLSKVTSIVLKVLHMSHAASVQFSHLTVTRSEEQYDFLAVDTNIHVQNNYDTTNFHNLRREHKACEEKSIFVCIMANQTIQKSFSRETLEP